MSQVSVIALVSAYNEADIIAQVVDDLVSQQISVYLLDDGSTDDTIARVEPFVGRGVIAIDRFWKGRRKGALPVTRPAVSGSTAKVGRNDPCPCGSGKKYKRCCGA